MKKFLGFLFTIFALSFSVFAQATNFDKQKYVWEDIQTFRINKEPARAFFLTFDNFENSIKPISVSDLDKIYENSSYLLLNGDWKFFFAKAPSDVKDDFFKPNFDDSKWDTLDVPNSWQCKGYDRIFYANSPAEFQFDYNGARLKGYEDNGPQNPSESVLNPKIPEIHRQVGVYRRTFDLPKNWDGKRVIARFNGVRTGFNLYINGNFVGYSEDSFTPAEFDITKFLKRGKNSIVAEVFKYSTGAYSEMQDMPHMVGIIRDVMLIARPQLSVADYYVDSKFSEDLKSADLNFSVSIKNASNKILGGSLEAFLIDELGNIFGGKPLFKRDIASVKPNNAGEIIASANVKNFKLWSPDKPNLYALVFKISDKDGNLLEAIRADFAFKKFALEGKNIRLNNSQKFFFKGANRHDWSPDKGKACSLSWMKKDVQLMKLANINAVRTSHYPNDDLFYMLCARYGLMILDEANHEQHGYVNTVLLDFEQFLPQSLDRIRNMVMRDRNRPSVVIFSLGNESTVRLAKGHEDMAKLVRELAPNIAVHSEPEARVVKDGKTQGWSDFVSGMYGGVSRMQGYLNLKNETRPFFFCEYAHAMGNAIGNLYGKWEMIRSNPKCLHGGFIWDWVDQALYLPREDEPSKLYLSDGRDWRTNPSANNFCQNGIIFADRTFSSKYREVQRVYQNIFVHSNGEYQNDGKISVNISNEFFDTNLNEFNGEIVLKKDGTEIARKKLPQDLDLSAGESKDFVFDLPPAKMQGGEFSCNLIFTPKTLPFWADKPQVYKQLPLAMSSNTQLYLLKDEKKPAQKFVGIKKFLDDKDSLIFNGTNGMEVRFDKNQAELNSLKIGGKELLVGPLNFDFSTAYIDNANSIRRDEREYALNKLKVAKASLEYSKLKSGAYRIICKKIYSNEDGLGFAVELVYTLDGARILVSANVAKLNDTPRELNLQTYSVALSLIPEIHTAHYYGRGDFANYCDRKYAADLSLYTQEVASFFEPFTKPQDTGNREDVRYLFLRGEKCGILIKPTTPLPISVLPYSQEELKKAKHPHNLGTPTMTQARVAWKVRGLGNSSCGPDTREQFKTSFSGSINWQFELIPILAKDAKNLGDYINSTLKLSEAEIYSPKILTENLQDDTLYKSPKGKLVSKNAKVSYSSIDPEWSPKKDTLLTTGDELFAFHTKSEKNPYLIVELDKVYELTSFEIKNRADERGDRTNRLVMYVSENGNSWKQVWKTEGHKPRWREDFKTPQKAKFVKIVLEKEREFFHLKQLKIYAKE